MPGLIHIFRMSSGLNMRRIRMTGFVRDGFGCNPNRQAPRSESWRRVAKRKMKIAEN